MHRFRLMNIYSVLVVLALILAIVATPWLPPFPVESAADDIGQPSSMATDHDSLRLPDSGNQAHARIISNSTE